MIVHKRIHPLVAYVCIAVASVFGFLLRAQETLSGNFLFLLDSGRDMMAVKQIVFDHKFTLIGPYTSLGGVFQGPLYYYLLAIPTAIFQGNPWGNILLMLVISLGVLCTVLLFMRTYFGLVPAVLTFAFFAFSPEAIAAATYFWNPHPMWLILVLYIFVLFGSIQNNTRAQLALWPLVFLSFHFEMAFGVFLSISTFLYVLVFQRNQFLRSKSYWIGFLLGIIFFLPQAVFELRHDFLMTRSVLKVFEGNSQGLITGGEHGDMYSVLRNNYITVKNNFASSFVLTAPFERFPWYMLALTIAVFLHTAFTKGFSKAENVFMHAVFFVAFFIIALSLVYPFPLRYWFLTGFQSFYIVLCGIILSKLYTSVAGKAILVAVLSVCLTYSVNKIQTLYVHPPNDGGLAKIQGKIRAIDYIYQDAKDSAFGVLVFTPPVITDAYEYLLWWRGTQKYGYVPHKNKEGLVYLLIEPDPEKPWSYKGWLETVIQKGTIASEVTFSSGLIIQKRMMSAL